MLIITFYYNLCLLKLFWQKQSPEVQGCICTWLRFRISKRFCWDDTSAWLFSWEFASCLYSTFLGEHFQRTASKHTRTHTHKHTHTHTHTHTDIYIYIYIYIYTLFFGDKHNLSKKRTLICHFQFSKYLFLEFWLRKNNFLWASPFVSVTWQVR